MRPFKPLIALGLIALACFAVIATGAPGDETAIHLDIPPQPVGAALDALASQSGLQPFYTDASVQGLESPGVMGRHTPQEAVERLLGTGLTYRFTGPKTVAIKKPERVAANDAANNAPKKPEAPPAKLEEVELPEMTVTASPFDATSYNPPNATTATKTDTPIMETPVSVQVVPEQVLKDQQAFRLEQALRNVSGVYAEPFGIFTGTGEVFNLRGFLSGNQYRNGFRHEIAFGGTGPLETANLDRIEVLKGPASILYGRIEPGGLINLVSKQPLSSPYYSLQQQIGSFDFYRTTLDATGPIAKDHGLFYRFNLAYENAGSFVEFVENERVFIAPTLRWEISPDTQATFELQYKHSRDPRPFGFPAIGDRPADLPRGTDLGEPLNEAKSDEVLFSFDWSHAFNDRWTLRHSFYGDWSDDSLSAAGVLDGRTGVRGIFFEETPSETYATSLDLTGKFDTWGLRHTLLSGADYYNYPSEWNQVFFSFTPRSTYSIRPMVER